MPISDEQFEDWLRADGKQRCILVEATVYSGGAETTRYMSNMDYVSEPSDTPSNIPYDAIVSQVPSFKSSVAEAFVGRSQASWGDIIVSNENGARDSWLNEAWDGRALKIYYGDPSWPKADFRLVLNGYSADIAAVERRRLAIRTRDKGWALNVNIQTNLIGGTTANKGRPVPITLGEVFNVEPRLIDAATHTYQVHDGAIEDVTVVRDNGLSIGAAFTKDLANGKFSLNAAPAGRITCDVKGAKPGGTYLTTCAEFVDYLVTGRTQLTSADIDATSLSDFDTLCPYTMGFHAADFMSVATAIDSLVISAGGFWTFSRDGLLTLGRLDVPSGDPVVELVADDVVQAGIIPRGRILPVKTYRVGYRRNHAVQADGVAGAVSETDRAALAREFLTASATNAGVDTTHLLAQNPEVATTLIAGETDAQTEADRRAELWSELRFLHQASCFSVPFKIQLGDVVRITHDDFDFDAGRLVRVIGMQDRLDDARVILDVFS